MSRGLIARITFGSLALLMVAGLIEYRTSAFPSRPLSKNELLPLVAGNVLPENVAFFFGPESPYLVGDLTAEAQALRQLGRSGDAAKLEQRTQTISATKNPN
jgi:hypothetical protein